MPLAKEIFPLTILGTCSGTALEHATKAQRGSRNTALLFFILGARWGWVVKDTPRPLYPRVKTMYLLYEMLGGLCGRFGRYSIPLASSP